MNLLIQKNENENEEKMKRNVIFSKIKTYNKTNFIYLNDNNNNNNKKTG